MMYYTVVSRDDRFIADGEQSNNGGRGKAEI